MIVTYLDFYKTMSNEISKELKDVAMSTLYAYGDIYENDYSFTVDSNERYVISDPDGKEVKFNTEFIDYLEADSGLDITLFYYDIRIMTTLSDSTGEKIVGTTANKMIVEEIMSTVTPKFYDNALINNEQYYAYYAPVVNKSGDCVGMVFAGRPVRLIKQQILSCVWPVIIVVLIMMIVMGAAASSAAAKLAGTINEEKEFLGALANGNLRANLNANILKRKDELGEMGLFTVKVQRFLRDMIERDALTKLYTRRIGEVKIQATQKEFIEAGVPYCVVMGDIDHFKRFNDTYGHDCGDLVLKTVANVFNQKLLGKGYAVRWGGEEFILIIEGVELDGGYEILEEVRENVLAAEVDYKDEKLKVTMTYGIIQGDDRGLNEIVKEVDELLYIGKEGGRNRIVKNA